MAGVYGLGTTLTVNSTPVANLTSIEGPEVTLETKDVTTHSSSGGYREFIPTVREGGEISLEGNFVDVTAADVLLDLLNAGTVASCVIQFPTTPSITWTFDAIVTKYKTTAPYDDKIGFTASLKISGEPVLA